MSLQNRKKKEKSRKKYGYVGGDERGKSACGTRGPRRTNDALGGTHCVS